VSVVVSPLVPAEEVLGLRVPEGAAADDVDEDERDGGDEQRDVGLAPLLAQAAEHAGLAGGAAVAELGGVVAPGRAVSVRRRVRRARPRRRAHVRVPAHRRRLAAAGLHAHPIGHHPSVRTDREGSYST
jgi:hypothetical protein